jgi:hypothetical protein
MKRRRFITTSAAISLLQVLPRRVRAEAATLPSGVEQLLSRFRESPGFAAKFVEEKRILLLKEPVINRGRVYFQRPGTFARYVDEPFASRVLLRDRRLRLEEGSQSQEIQLDAQPAVRALVGGFLSLLEGDQAALLGDYQVRFESSQEAGWKVLLTPRAAPVDRLLKGLTFSGKAAEISEMSWIERSGDTSHTRFSEVQVRRVFTEAEKRELFTPRVKG